MDTQAPPADHSAGPTQAGMAPHDRNRSDSVEGIVEGMLALHGDRENPHTLWISARGEIAKRG